MKWKRAAFFVLYLLALFLFQEGVFRFFTVLPEVRNFNRVQYTELAIPSEQAIDLTRLQYSIGSSPDGVEFIHRLNSYGFRDREWQVRKREGNRRVIFVGDSFVEGEMASEDQVIPRGFENAMERAGSQGDVMNMGIVGTGLGSYLRLIVDAVPIFHPDEVFLIIYANDLPFSGHIRFESSLQPDYGSFYEPRLITLAKMLIRGQNVPLRWSHRSIDYFPTVPDPANPWTHNERLLSPHVRPDIAEAMKAGTFNPFVVNIVAQYENNLRTPIDLDRQLAGLQKYMEKFQTKLWVVYIPTRSQVTTHYLRFDQSYCLTCPDTLDLTGKRYQRQRRQLRKSCAALRIPFLDLTPWAKESEERGHHLYWEYDDHMRGESYLEVGEQIYQWSASFEAK